MEELNKYINKNIKDAYKNFKVVGILYDKEINKFIVKIIYDENFDFNKEIKIEVKKLIYQFLNIKDIDVELKIKKSLLDKSAIKILVESFIRDNYEFIYSTMTKHNIKIGIDDKNVEININVSPIFYQHFTDKLFTKKLTEFLLDNYFAKFIINVKKVDNEINNEYEEEFNNYINNVEELFMEEDIDKINYYNVTNIENVIGENLLDEVLPLDSLDKIANKKINVAGIVEFLNIRTFKKKKANSEETEDKEFFSFIIKDDYGKLNCVFFPNKENREQFDSIQNGVTVLLSGILDNYRDNLSLKVKTISKCTLPKKQIEPVTYKKENENYMYVSPQPYISLQQSNLFDVIIENKNKFLEENDCVVFDLETTGIEASTCEIIEIGACKIRNGKIIETFSVLVKPKMEIPSNITELTGISNEMVEHCLSIEQVLQDFYKFSRNSVLVAYNIAFDYKFISIEGNKQGYLFDNKQIDCYMLAKLKLKGLKNYKLKTVVEKLDVSLENAHRAVHDALATAEAFLKLVDDDMSEYYIKN